MVEYKFISVKNSDLTFDSLGVDASLCELLRGQGIVSPTPVQALSIPRVLSGDSLAVRSQTGSGKSLAYVLPLIQRLREDADGVVLILVPTRELVGQLGRVFEGLGCSVAMIYGGVDYEPQREVLASMPRVIVATPGRLLDLLEQGATELANIRYFVLDEVDEMVSMGFREPIIALAGRRMDSAQSLCFTATLRDEVRETIVEIVGAVDVVEESGRPLAAQRIVQRGYFVENSMMDHLLLHLLRQKSPSRAILFCRSRKMADRLAGVLRDQGFEAEAIHSDRSQVAREHIMRRFTEGETRLLVATDLVARGIDIDGVSHVFNFGLPLTPDQYVHRIGRTGRAGAEGEAITLLCPDERRKLSEICATMRQNVVVEQNHPYITPAVTRALGC